MKLVKILLTPPICAISVALAFFACTARATDIPQHYVETDGACWIDTGLVAKEAVVSSLTLLTGAGSAGLSAALHNIMSPLGAYCYLVFILLYVPCIAATATIHRELGKARYTALVVAYQIGVAYLISFIIHTVGTLIL